MAVVTVGPMPAPGGFLLLFDVMDQDLQIAAAVRALVDDYRDRCLWFLRPDYYPQSADEIRRVMRSIREHGDRDAFLRARRIEEWLSRHTSDKSAAS